MANPNETVKKTVEETAANAQAQAEAVHAAGTKVFREGVAKSLSSLSEMSSHSKKNLEAVVESASAAQRGAEALSQEVLAYSKKSWEDGVAAAQSISRARSVQELVELQTNWAKSATEAYLAQFSKTADILSASLNDSVKPISARVSETVERLQAAR